VVNKQYLQRLELENDLYRRHLHKYEQGVADNLISLVRIFWGGTQGIAGGPDAVTAHQDDMLARADGEALSDSDMVERV
jgi:hypothetical protein